MKRLIKFKFVFNCRWNRKFLQYDDIGLFIRDRHLVGNSERNLSHSVITNGSYPCDDDYAVADHRQFVGRPCKPERRRRCFQRHINDDVAHQVRRVGLFKKMVQHFEMKSICILIVKKKLELDPTLHGICTYLLGNRSPWSTPLLFGWPHDACLRATIPIKLIITTVGFNSYRMPYWKWQHMMWHAYHQKNTIDKFLQPWRSLLSPTSGWRISITNPRIRSQPIPSFGWASQF